MAEKVLRKALMPMVEVYFAAAEALYQELPQSEREYIGRRMMEGALDVVLSLQRSESEACFPEECDQALYGLMEAQACLKLLNSRRDEPYPESEPMQDLASVILQTICPEGVDADGKSKDGED